MPAPSVVLDTNVVLDWTVFRDPRVVPLTQAIEAGRIAWFATPTMRAELEHVLTRGSLSARSVAAAPALEVWDRWVRPAPEPPQAQAPRLRCSDADDQKFIDLAIALRARWLVTHDRALLALRRRARGHGVDVLTPGRWRPTDTP